MPNTNTLKEIRKIKGLTQSELAAIVGTSSVNISYLEIKKRGLSAEWIEKLSHALGCTKAQLLGEQSLEGLGKLPEEIQQDQRNYLTFARTKKGLSINELAKKIGVSRQLIWRFESGKSTLSKEVLEKIAGALQVTVEYLTTGRDANQESRMRLVSSNNYPVKEIYLGYAMEIVDRVSNPDLHSREEKQHMLTEAYKMVYDFFENNQNKEEYVKELKSHLLTASSVLKFITRDLKLNSSTTNGRSPKRFSHQKS